MEALRRVAETKSCTGGQPAVAWAAAQGEDIEDIEPLVGARIRERLAEELPSDRAEPHS